MEHKLPALPFAKDALAPIISAELTAIPLQLRQSRRPILMD